MPKKKDPKPNKGLSRYKKKKLLDRMKSKKQYCCEAHRLTSLRESFRRTSFDDQAPQCTSEPLPCGSTDRHQEPTSSTQFLQSPESSCEREESHIQSTSSSSSTCDDTSDTESKSSSHVSCCDQLHSENDSASIVSIEDHQLQPSGSIQGDGSFRANDSGDENAVELNEEAGSGSVKSQRSLCVDDSDGGNVIDTDEESGSDSIPLVESVHDDDTGDDSGNAAGSGSEDNETMQYYMEYRLLNPDDDPDNPGDPDDDDDDHDDGSDNSGSGEENNRDEDNSDDSDDEDNNSIGSVNEVEEGDENVVNEDNPDDPIDPVNPGAAEDSDNSDQEGVNFNLINAQLNVVCQGIRNCTLREVLALMLALTSKHRLTYDALLCNMRLFNTIYGRRYLPLDKKQLWALLGRREVGIRKYVYCNNCLRGHGRLRQFPAQLQCGCGTLIRKRFCKIYIDLSMVKQLEDLLRRQSIRNDLAYRQERQLRVAGAMADIVDGRQYRHLREPGNVLASVFDNSFTFNLDGMRLAKTSNAQAWPVYGRWNELSPKLRHKHMILAGVWVDLQEPNMNVYLEQFVNQVNFLSNVGVLWQPDGHQEEVRSKFVPTCCVVDAQARCKILNQKSPSGYCACIFCDHRGVHCGGAVHYPILPPIPNPVLRTHEEIRACMVEAVANGGQGDGHILGFKGASRLMLMDHFDLGKNVVTDDMHPFSGVIELHTTILLTRTRQHRPEYYIGDALLEVDRRMQSIRTPSHISRKPRSLRFRHKWNASEWRNWLLYYLVPCLEGILPLKYLRHFQMLAQAVFLVSKDYVSEEDCNDAENLFLQYVIRFERYFGRSKMTYNVHILLHVAECVRLWGPMPGQSTSFYEEWNHTLAQTVTSPNARADQIVTRFLMKRFLSKVQDNELISDIIKRQVHIILENPRLRDYITVGNVTLLGRKDRRPPSARETQLLNQHNEFPEELIVYKRASIGDIEYRSSDYRYAGEETKSDDSHVYTWNGEFAEIVTIALFGEEEQRRIFVFLKILNTNAHVNRYICRVAAGEDVLIAVTFEDIRIHAILCENPTGSLVMSISNAWELD